MTDRETMQQALEALIKCKAALAEELAAWDIDPPLHHVQESHDLCGPTIAALQERLAHCDRCGKKLGGEGDIHTCTPPVAQRSEQVRGMAQPNRGSVGVHERMRFIVTVGEILHALRLAQDALHMATLPFPIDEVKTQRALEAVDKVCDALEPRGQA